MKRLGNVYSKIYDIDNINEADSKARRNKGRSRKHIARHDKNKELENQMLSDSLRDNTYRTSEYTSFKIYEPKERIIYKLPYYPDRICHHATLNVLKSYWESLFIEQTYSCIKGRGIHKCLKDVRKALKDKKNTRYCLQIDIKKFYPSINHEILKQIIHKKIKDKGVLYLLDEFVDSVKGIEGYEEKGIPIGNWTSQYFGNLYLTPLDYFCKQELKCKYYFRYADDIRIFSNNKKYLHSVLLAIKQFCATLKVKVKDNYAIVDMKHGTDFLGYVIFHNKVRLRKRIKNKLLRLVGKLNKEHISIHSFFRSYASYYGWLKYCDSKNLQKKIVKYFKNDICDFDSLKLFYIFAETIG